MEHKDKKVNGGISLKRINYLVSIVTIAISAVLLVATVMTQASYRQTYNSTLNYIDWEQTAEKLQAGSDYLTDQVRSYAATGNLAHLYNYFNEVQNTRRRDYALELLEEHLRGTESYTYLENALRESNKLMEIEYYSMALAATSYGQDISKLPQEIQDVKLKDSDLALSKEEQREVALDMLFDGIYHGYKERISYEVENSIKILGKMTEENLNVSFLKLKRLLIIQQVLIVVMVVVVASVIILTLTSIVHPLVRAIPQIKEEKTIPVTGAYEFRYLASTYNKMYESNVQHKKLLAYEATHDTLTNVLNRKGFQTMMQSYDLSETAIVLVDIDDFKGKNDSYGHAVGDSILIKLADLLKKYFRQSDIICRMGGDEFVVILTNVGQNLEQKESIVDKINKINNIISTPKDDVPSFTISAGVAFGDNEIDVETLLKNSDKALYQVKETGKKSCAFYN